MNDNFLIIRSLRNKFILGACLIHYNLIYNVTNQY